MLNYISYWITSTYEEFFSAPLKKMDLKCQPKFIDCVLEKNSSYMYMWVYNLHIYEEFFFKPWSLNYDFGNTFFLEWRFMRFGKDLFVYFFILLTIYFRNNFYV